MAIYVWKCEKCQTTQEIERKMEDSDVPPDTCECGVGVWTKMISPCSFSLKGGGWFKDGYQAGDKK